ncbi:MAG TPA: guanylate kinase [Thermomicrobiales bacterium]|nr:guanylate kinase [Thermomicrobiales bacterium]
MLDERTDGLAQQTDELIAEIRAAMRPRLFVISGPSGVGKDTVIDGLRTRMPDFYFAVTATTRPRRPGEADGVHYLFVTEEQFIEDREHGEFIEFAEVYGYWYGVPKHSIRAALRNGRDVIVKVDVQGSATIRQLAPEAVLIFLMPPSLDDLFQRLLHRKTDGENVVLRRIRTSAHELTMVRQFDYAVFNEEDRLDQTLDQILAIMTAERLRVHQPSLDL